MKVKENYQISLTREDEEALWESGQLGNSSPRSLLNTMWWLLSQHFGLRGCQEHYTMNEEDFTLNKDDNGNEFVTFAESPTKTRQGGLRVQPRSALPTTGESRCPVALFKNDLFKRLEDLKLSGPFYLACIDNPITTDVWYKKSRMGKNTISSVKLWNAWKKTRRYKICILSKDYLTTQSGKRWSESWRLKEFQNPK